ncbi:MAG: cation:proton antiporter [Muribaculaceae bacterium]|nr:cation:proton antiporter [Muribaculaceae bacterium]
MNNLFSLPFHQPVVIFSLVLLLILAAPVVFRRLRIPDVVGLILAGVAVGPYGFNLLERDASFQIFGQVGILYLMFLAAVEIDMYHFKKNLRQGLVFGLMTFIIPSVLGMAAAHYAFGAGITTCLLLASMYSSHTLISYPVVSRFGLQNGKGVILAVSATIVAVLLALITLASVVKLQATGVFDVSDILKLLLYTVGYAIVVGFTFPRITRFMFRKFSDAVAQYIFILAMVFIGAVLAQMIGLESILGAFYVGLVLNRLIPGRSSLMHHIKFVGNAIFIPYFLIGVGMLINVHVIFRGWTVAWVTLNMIVVALVSKWIAAWLAQKSFGLTSTDRRMMFGLTSGKAAATIAATMLGYQYGIINEDIMNGAVLMILACCLVASVMTERTAIRMRIELTAAEMEASGIERPEFARQIVAVSNPITAEGLMRLAVFMRSPKNTEPITALFVRNSDDPKSLRAGRFSLRTAAQAAQEMGVVAVEEERFDLNVVSGLTNMIHQTHATDIVIGFHRKANIVDTFFGQMVDTLLKETLKMVVMSRCFIPISTVRRIVVVAGAKAQFETGFHDWVARVGNLAQTLACKVIFIVSAETSHYIEDIITNDGYGIRRIYQEMTEWDDFILLSGNVGPEDLLIIIGARRGSISYSASQEEIPEFLSKNFASHNLMVIYPEQFNG